MRAPSFILLCGLTACGCASSGTVPVPRSVLAVRAPQARSYEKSDRRAVLSALVQGLQDAGFQVGQVDFDAGFVSANAERVEGREAPGFVKAALWPYALAFPRLFGRKTHTVVEATGTVVDEGDGQRLRIVCRTKALDAGGAVKRLHEVDDPKFYQDLFARIDKALFLAGQGL
jgi:hypothetical protein